MMSERSRDIARGRLSRRLLLGSGAAAGLFASAAALADTAPRRGGTLRLALTGGGQGQSWDTATHQGTFMTVASQGAVYDCLTEISATGALVGELVSGWESSGDAQEWVFHLRQGVDFHDGRTMTARDVVASLDYHFKTPCHVAEQVESVHALDDLRVRVRLICGNTALPYLLADKRLVIYPARDRGGVNLSGIGTGLYRVVSGEPGQALNLLRQADHYKNGSAGWFDAVELRSVEDHSARLRMLSDGFVDAIDALDPAWSEAATFRPKFKQAFVEGNAHLLIQAADHRESSRLAVRAIGRGLDRAGLLAQSANGKGEVASDIWFGRAKAVAMPQNGQADRTRLMSDHLTSAGVRDIALHMGRSDHRDPVALRAANALRRALDAAGISLSVTGPDQADASIRLAMEAGASNPDEALGRFSDPRLDLARRSTVSSEKDAVYDALLAERAEHLGVVVPFFADHAFGHAPGLAHTGVLGRTATLDSARIAERWWRV